LKEVVARGPATLLPFTRTELELLAKGKFPDAPRDNLRKIARNFASNSKRGPRGPRNPHRKQQLIEFREKIIPAQLRN
jgi:hypothetical protein